MSLYERAVRVEDAAGLAQTTYAGCNDSHFTELLGEREGIAVSRVHGAALAAARRAAESKGKGPRVLRGHHLAVMAAAGKENRPENRPVGLVQQNVKR